MNLKSAPLLFGLVTLILLTGTPASAARSASYNAGFPEITDVLSMDQYKGAGTLTHELGDTVSTITLLKDNNAVTTSSSHSASSPTTKDWTAFFFQAHQTGTFNIKVRFELRDVNLDLFLVETPNVPVTH